MASVITNVEEKIRKNIIFKTKLCNREQTKGGQDRAREGGVMKNLRWVAKRLFHLSPWLFCMNSLMLIVSLLFSSAKQNFPLKWRDVTREFHRGHFLFFFCFFEKMSSVYKIENCYFFLWKVIFHVVVLLLFHVFLKQVS